MFTYCLNNPVIYSDTLGSVPILFSKIQAVAIDGTTSETSSDLPIDSNPKNTPPNHPNYIPPKKGPEKKKNPNGNGWGWVDKEGNVWVWTPDMHGGPGWTVQKPDGGHSHAYPGGGTRTHFEAIFDYEILEVFPAIPTTTQIFSTPSTFVGGCAALVFVVVMCESFLISMRGKV